MTETTPLPYPRALTHVGISVTELDRGIEFYRNVFGARIIHGPNTIRAGDDLIGRTCRDFFGPDFGEARVVYMATSNGVALELFEFIKPKAERRTGRLEYWKTGAWHLCLIDPEVDLLVERIVANGGRRLTETLAPWGDPSKSLALCEDPFGNVLEIYSQSTEQMVSNLHHE